MAVCKIPRHLGKEEIQKLKRQFLAIDEDKSGEISIKELRSVLEDPKLCLSEKDIDDLIAETDLNKSWTIDLCEFLNLMSKHKNKELMHRALIYRSTITKAFRKLDKDGDGYLTKEELKKAMRKADIKITDATFDAMFNDSDVNKDGKIDYGEFVMVMTS